MIKGVAISDIHADFRYLGVERFDEVERGVERAVDVAIERGVDFFAFLGDAADPDSGPVVLRAQALLIRAALRLRAAGIPFIAIAGNHDGSAGARGETTLTPLAALSEDHDGSPIVVAGEPDAFCLYANHAESKCNVVCLPYPAKARRYDPAEFVERLPERPGGLEYELVEGVPTIVLSHLFPVEGIDGGEEGSEMPRGGPLDLPLAAIDSLPGPVVVLQGHFHKREVIRRPNRSPIFVVGSLLTLTHGEEPNESGFLYLEI